MRRPTGRPPRAAAAEDRPAGRARSPPSRSTTTRSASATASATSWVIRIVVKPCSRQMRVEQAVHLDPGQRVERAERLVEQQHAGPADQGAGQRHALALAAGQHRRPVVGAVGEADIGRAPLAAVSRQPGLRAMPTLSSTRCQGSSRASWNSSRTSGCSDSDRRAVDRDRRRASRVEPGDQAQQRGLAAARAADDRDELRRPGSSRSRSVSTCRVAERLRQRRSHGLDRPASRGRRRLRGRRSRTVAVSAGAPSANS